MKKIQRTTSISRVLILLMVFLLLLTGCQSGKKFDSKEAMISEMTGLYCAPKDGAGQYDYQYLIVNHDNVVKFNLDTLFSQTLESAYDHFSDVDWDEFAFDAMLDESFGAATTPISVNLGKSSLCELWIDKDGTLYNENKYPLQKLSTDPNYLTEEMQEELADYKQRLQDYELTYIIQEAEEDFSDWQGELDSALTSARNYTSNKSECSASADTIADCAFEAIKEYLKYPLSAELVSYSAEPLRDSYGRVMTGIVVKAQNGFGNYLTEDYYVVLQSVLSFGGSTDYSFYQNGMCYEKGDLSDFELYALQLLNDWDEDPDYDKSKETAYSDGITLAENGNYEAAIQKLGALEGYKASDNVVGTCKNYQLSQEYKDAIDLFAEKHYAQAAAALTELLKNQENGYLRAERALYLCDYYADEDVGSAEEADNEATTPAEELPTAGAWGELPRVCSFEYDLNSAIGSYYRSKGYSEDEYEYLLAKDYEVTDFAEYEDAGCDQAISGLYCDRAFHFLACVKNDKVYLCESIMAQDVLPNFTNATEEEQITWLQQLMIPVTAYCYDMDPCDLVEQIFQNGEETEENVWVLTLDGIEYTLVIANDQVDFTIDARAWLSDGELEMNNAASEEPLPTTETGGDVSKAPSYGNDQNKNQGNNGSSGSAPSGSTGNSGTDGSASSGSTGSSSESIQTTPTVPTEPPSSCEMWGHDWVPITETVHHDEAGHYETYQDAKKVQHYKCFYCGYNTEFNSLDEYYAHYDQKHEDKPDMRERYDVVDRWEYYDAQRWVVDTPAYDESVVTGYVCSVCGATK